MSGKKVAKKEAPQLDPAQKEKLEVLRRVNSPKANGEDRAAFRALLKQDAAKWRAVTDMMTQARRAFVEGATSSAMSQEIMNHACDELRQELAQPEDGALEKMLIDVAVFAWLRLSVIEQGYTAIYGEPGGTTLTKGIFWEKRLNAAHKRFERACTNLARVRKLLRPKVTNKLSIGAINALVNGGGEPVPANVGALLKGKDIFGKQQQGAN